MTKKNKILANLAKTCKNWQELIRIFANKLAKVRNLKEEYDSLRCKNFTSNKRGGNRYLPFVFTREGIAMLSGLLRSEIAIKANINIMRAFFQMQEALLIVSNTQLQLKFFFVPDVIEKRKPLPAAQAKKNKNFFVISSCFSLSFQIRNFL